MSSEIKRLSDESVRRIVAEQAITDLASIVKELVDNALDAESTTIKSKLRPPSCLPIFLMTFTDMDCRCRSIRSSTVRTGNGYRRSVG